jgi:hypothetical protein
MWQEKRIACRFELSVRTSVQIEQATLRIIEMYLSHYSNKEFPVDEIAMLRLFHHE